MRDLAARLGTLDPARVAFEPLNEPPQSCGAADWTVMQSELLRTARLAAPDLTLVATGACGSMIAGLEALDPARIGDPNIIYTFHFYEPYVFSHQGAPWMSGEPIYRYLNAVPWPASAGVEAADARRRRGAHGGRSRDAGGRETRDRQRPSSACSTNISTPIRTGASSSAISRA